MITIDGKTEYKTKNITGIGFRLVHNNTKVVALIEGTRQTITSTNHEAEEWDIEQEILNRIAVLGLEYEYEEYHDRRDDLRRC